MSIFHRSHPDEAGFSQAPAPALARRRFPAPFGDGRAAAHDPMTHAAQRSVDLVDGVQAEE